MRTRASYGSVPQLGHARNSARDSDLAAQDSNGSYTSAHGSPDVAASPGGNATGGAAGQRPCATYQANLPTSPHGNPSAYTQLMSPAALSSGQSFMGSHLLQKRSQTVSAGNLTMMPGSSLFTGSTAMELGSPVMYTGAGLQETSSGLSLHGSNFGSPPFLSGFPLLGSVPNGALQPPVLSLQKTSEPQAFAYQVRTVPAGN